VFVDDSGRRRRLTRLIGTTLSLGALTYVGFVGVTFAGVPGLAGIDAAGLGQLTNPAGDQADVGSDPVEQAVPAAVDDGGVAPGPPTSVAPGDGGPATSTGASPTTATSAPTTTTLATTTTTTHGHGTATPNSTVPDKGGGPPTSRGGQ
jgi:hypothetical protein